MRKCGETLSEIDRRVGVALGWRWDEGDGEVVEPGWVLPDGKDARRATGVLSLRFSTDPAAADLVRQEIERRGWRWSISGPLYEDDGWLASVGVSYHRSPFGVWWALCVAFLEEDEAAKRAAERLTPSGT